MHVMQIARSRPRKTLDEFFALPGGVRAEFIDGEIYVSPSPTPDHQTVALNLAVCLREHDQHGGEEARRHDAFHGHLPIILSSPRKRGPMTTGASILSQS